VYVGRLKSVSAPNAKCLEFSLWQDNRFSPNTKTLELSLVRDFWIDLTVKRLRVIETAPSGDAPADTA
jgi:hypothetical protein